MDYSAQEGQSDIKLFEYSDIGPRVGDLVPTLPGCVCLKVKEMGPFSASRE